MSFIHNTEAYYNFSQTDVDAPNKGKIENGCVFMSKHIDDHEWIYPKELFADLFSHFQEGTLVQRILAELGGIEGICYALRTSKTMGLPSDEVKDSATLDYSREIRYDNYSSNSLTKQPAATFFELCLNELEDFMLRILIVCSLISIIVGLIFHFDEEGWVDGIAILFAVCIVVLVGAANNYSKEKQFRIMESESAKKNTIVLRNGKEEELLFENVVPGDLVVLRAGYQIPCDGVFVLGTSNFRTDESGLTGETREIRKSKDNPLLMAGTNVASGDGLMIASALGDYSQWGQLMAGLQEKRHETPLQERLDRLGVQIGYIGMAVGALLFLVVMIAWFIRDERDVDKNGKEEPYGEALIDEIIDAAIAGVIIVVVAVPEGLPLAVTISLAYSMKTMLVDNNFVRHLSACETMGNATTICSDKTGTLTQNKMSVVKAFFCNDFWYNHSSTGGQSEITSNKVRDLIKYSQIINSKAFYEDSNDVNKRLVGGNQTECALLQWAVDLGGSNYKDIRKMNPVTKYYPFDSSVKRSSVLVREPSNLRDEASEASDRNKGNFVMYTKGAAEQVLELCSSVVVMESDRDDDGPIRTEPMTPEVRERVVQSMNRMTRSGLRCIGLCYKPFDTAQSADIKDKYLVDKEVGEGSEKSKDGRYGYLFSDMVWMCLVGIKDPVRKEVPQAVLTCQNAGIIVRMVTGDHLETARHIAKECNILSCPEHICMQGFEFRQLTEEEKLDKLPNLRVLARSKPQDKEELVRWYMKHGDVVAVTGDGANDALALKEANIGLSMGIQGTDVAKEASDIVIMDDNFKSIEKTVMWGRSVYDNIRKFMQFQLTVNISALSLSLIAAFWEEYEEPLNPVQLLWVNLIMDTMAALALATERPTVKLLERLPFDKNGSIISPVMFRFMFGHGLYQLAWLLFTLFYGEELLDIEKKTSGDNKNFFDGQNRELLTVVFNLFVWFQIFNEINARRVNDEWNVLEGFFANSYFTLILFITVVLQVIIVVAGGDFLDTHPIDGIEWAYCIGVGATSLVWNQLLRLIPVDTSVGLKEIDVDIVFKRDPDFINNNEDEDVEVVTG